MDFADAAWLSGNAAAARTWIPTLPTSNETDKTMKYVHAVLNQVDVNADTDAEFMAAIDVLREQPSVHPIQGGPCLRYWPSSPTTSGRFPAYLRTAAEGFALIGATPWTTRATEELRASGERSRRRYASERRDELTPQELQIARRRRSRTHKPGDRGKDVPLSPHSRLHLYRIYPKLGINSRADLPTALARHDPRPRSTADLTARHQSRSDSQ